MDNIKRQGKALQLTINKRHSSKIMGKRKRIRDSKVQIPNDILFNIFKRLPAKSLMRFKCVCKSWKTLVSDPYFAKLHYKHSRIRPNASYLLFYLRTNSFSARSIFPTNLKAVFSAGIPTHNFLESLPCTDIVNGLICLFDRKNHQLDMLNITTGEKVRLPWYHRCTRPEQFRNPSLFLGFDPREKKYKVLFITRKFDGKVLSEILTLGTNCWRNTRNYPTLEKFQKGAICVNGMICWKDITFMNDRRVVLFFDVRKEKFGTLFPPKSAEGIVQLTQIGNDIALVCRPRLDRHLLELWTLSKKDKKWCKIQIKLGRISVSRLEVIGSTRKTSEILMTAKSKFSDMLQLIFYDLGKENVRTTKIACPGMPNLAAGNLLSYNASAAVSNHVENFLPLKF